jgi:hypothetical protein
MDSRLTSPKIRFIFTAVKKKSYEKKQWRPPSKKKKGGKNLSPMRNRKACHSIPL